jgi:hypothetical protein
MQSDCARSFISKLWNVLRQQVHCVGSGLFADKWILHQDNVCALTHGAFYQGVLGEELIVVMKHCAH